VKKAYIETSSVNAAVDAAVTASQLGERLSALEHTAVVGLHVIYELAKTFLLPGRASHAQALFRFLEVLDPSYSPGAGNLLGQEVARLRTGAAVLPFLDHENLAATRTEVGRLARGYFDDRARDFINNRENDIDVRHPEMMRLYIDKVAELRSRDPAAAPKFSTFALAREHFTSKFPELVRGVLRGSVNQQEAAEIAARLDSFPAVRAAVNANIYLMFICISQGDIPSTEKLDDYRHFIEAAYVDSFLTNDSKQGTAAHKISPGIDVIAWGSLW
jgi:hypothetical protein